MKSVIMAGGEGSRLRPLTCDLPKPMARLCGRPVLEYILELLGMHGVREATLALGYLPDRVKEHFPDGRYGEMLLRFVEEERPLGTAGSVRNACAGDEEELLVISGDALCDFHLSRAMQMHRERHADVTILAKRVADPREYGLILCDRNHRITAFLEKPAYSQAVSDLANTGVYLLSRRALDMIPEGKPYDFAKDLFPRMLAQGMALLCCQDEGYWCDIGDLQTYMRCQRDMLEGKVKCGLHANRDNEGNWFAGARPQGRYTLVPPVYIGKNVTIEDNCRIEAGTVLDDGCTVCTGARVRGSVLLPNAYIGQRARLTDALVASGAGVKADAMLFEGSAIGAGAVVGEKAMVGAGVKVWNGKVVPASVQLRDHVKTGQARRGLFDELGIHGQIGIELTPEFCARLGAAIGSLYTNARVAIGYSAHRSASVLASAIAAGIQSTGAGVMDFGENFQARFAFSVSFSGLQAGVFVCGEERAYLHVVGEGGLPAGRSLERNVEAILARGEFARCSGDGMGDRVEIGGMDQLYRSHLIRCAPKGLAGVAAQVHSPNLTVRELMRETLLRLGCDSDGQLVLELSAQGDEVRVLDAAWGEIPPHKVLCICAAQWMERGNDVAVPFDAPRVLDGIAQRTGRKLLRYAVCPADDGDREARKLAEYQMWSRDGLMQGILFLHLLKQAGSLRRLLDSVPEYQRRTRMLDTTGSVPSLMQRLGAESHGRITEGVLLREKGGVALVRPLKSGAAIRIIAEARSSETAAELCDFVEGLLQDGKN